MIELELAMIYRLEVRGPLESSIDSESSPRHQYWEMTRATLEGPHIRGVTPISGIDWFTPYPGGYGRPHVRLPFQTDDGALVLMEYRGIVHATDAFLKAVQHDTATEWSDQYMRMAITFETTARRYAWLTHNLFVARGHLLAAKSIEYEVYRMK